MKLDPREEHGSFAKDEDFDADLECWLCGAHVFYLPARVSVDLLVTGTGTVLELIPTGHLTPELDDPDGFGLLCGFCDVFQNDSPYAHDDEWTYKQRARDLLVKRIETVAGGLVESPLDEAVTAKMRRS